MSNTTHFKCSICQSSNRSIIIVDWSNKHMCELCANEYEKIFFGDNELPRVKIVSHKKDFEDV